MILSSSARRGGFFGQTARRKENRIASRAKQAVDVEPFGEQVEGAIGMTWPLLDQAVPGKLEAVLVGAAQIEGLVGAVITGAVERNAGRDQAAERVGKRGAGRIEDGRVVEA